MLKRCLDGQAGDCTLKFVGIKQTCWDLEASSQDLNLKGYTSHF